METGFADLVRRWRWLGRRYAAGFLHGLWLGIVIGAGLAVYLHLEKEWTILYFYSLGMLAAGGVVMYLGDLIAGKAGNAETHPSLSNPDHKPGA